MLANDLKNAMPQLSSEVFILTEGKTDWKHLEKAYCKLKIDVKMSFHKEEECLGNRLLLERCRNLSKSPFHQEKPLIFIFDNDDNQLSKEVADPDKGYKSWGNNVFSFIIPIPAHRKGHDKISIEYYYSDDEIKTINTEGRRLFISSEFSESSGRHTTYPNISYGNKNKLRGITDLKKSKIIDSDVYDENNRNLALSKSDFADAIYAEALPFDHFKFDAFGDIFRVIKLILSDYEKVSLDEEDIIEEDARRKIEVKPHKDNPPILSIFVGRHAEIDKINDDRIRVAAITGLGGEGKSSLAAKLFDMAMKNETITKYERCGWCDCKDLETPFHQKLLGILEDLTDGEESKIKYADENIDNTIERFIRLMNEKACLVIFDNIDAFIDKDRCSFTGNIRDLFDRLTNSLARGLVIFTCRPSINDYHFSFLEIPIGGLSYSESRELAQNFGILGTKIDETFLKDLYESTKGHALWLNLTFAQIRSGLLTNITLNKLFSDKSDILDSLLLKSIWSNLSVNEKEVISIISTFTRPPNLDKILKASGKTFHKCSRFIRSLVRLRMLIEIDANGETLYDLHPIIRVKAKDECNPQKKKQLCEKVIVVLSYVNNWKKLKTIIMNCDSYIPDIDGYVECVEIAIENRNYKKAIDYLEDVSDALLKYGEDAKFIELATELMKNIDQDTFQIGINPKLSSIYHDYINCLLNQGQFTKVDELLSDLTTKSQTISQYIFYTELLIHSLWFRNDFKGAIDAFNIATEKIKEKGERVPSGMQYDNALALRDHGEISKALEYFLNKTDIEKIRSWDPETDSSNYSADVGNISRCYYLLGNLDLSLELCKKSVQRLEKGRTRQDRMNHGYGLLWLSDIYVKQGNDLAARQNLSKAFEIWRKYCPSRLNKIRDHVSIYSADFKMTLPRDLV